ncbi:hypothetical protein IFM89_010261 [Coptis chinensis]|uniref:CP-type G domain-containing protein n=1 Tax=Coptis chinensis TaxID=261450 RepID=A0A835HU79_9MAGN|nr:hypothetical protein IFM89_010261 [Coptis chinensis]
MSKGWSKIVKKGLGEMGFNKGGGVVNWFPGHMAAATRAIRDRLKLSDLVIEVRDSRIPISSVNTDLQSVLATKRRVIALNKKDLANPNIMHKWVQYFEDNNQDCLLINAHSKNSVQKLLDLVEWKLKEVISREPTLLVMVIGVPNVGKSTVINSIHQIASTRFPAQGKKKRATVGPLPGVTQDIAGYKIAHQPSIYVLDTPGVLVPSIPDIETGLKLALTGSVKDSVVGEERLAQYLLAILNSRSTPLHWKHLNNRRLEGVRYYTKDKEARLKDLLPKKRKQLNDSDVLYIEDLVTEVQCALYVTLADFDGNLEDENDLESLIEKQFLALQRAFKIPPNKASDEARTMVSKKFLTLFRTGKLGPFTLDDVPDAVNLDLLIWDACDRSKDGDYFSVSSYQVLVFLCIKSVPVPYVKTEERFLVGRIGPKEYRLYRCIVRYGYHDIHKDDQEFEKDLVCSITEFIRSGRSKLNDLEEKNDGKMTVVGTSSTNSEGIQMYEN